MDQVQNENERPLTVAECQEVITGLLRASGRITTGLREKAASELLMRTNQAFLVSLTNVPEGVFARCIAHRTTWSCTFFIYTHELQGTGRIDAPESASPVQLEAKQPDKLSPAELSVSPGRKKRQRQ